jgi:hypothetical protein
MRSSGGKMTQYKRYFIDAGFEKFYNDRDWFFTVWGGTYIGSPGQQIVGDIIPKDRGLEIESVAGIRILGFYARIGASTTSYDD